MCDSRFKLDDVSIQTPHLYQSEHHRRHRAVIKPSSNSYKFTVAANYTVNMMPSIGAATIRKLSPPNVKDVYLVTLPEQQSISQTVDHTSSGFRECRFVPTGDKSIRIGSKSVHWGKISGKVELDLHDIDGTALPKNPFNLSRTVFEQYPPAGAVQPVFVLWKSIGCNGASLWIK